MAQRLEFNNHLEKLLGSLVLVKVKEIPLKTFGGFSFSIGLDE